MGLLDVFNTMEGQQALGLLAAAGPRADGAGFGQRLQEGLGSADMWKARQAHLAQQAQAAKMQEMQMQQMQSQLAQQQKVREIAQQFARPGTAGLAPLAGDPSTGILPSARKPATQAGFDQRGYANALMQAGLVDEGRKELAMLQKENQINKLDVKDFSPASVQKFQQTGNYGDLVRLDKAHFANTGGKTVALDSFTGQPLNSIDNTQSPDSKASNAVAWANNAVSRDRLGFEKTQAGKPQFHDGSWVLPPTAENPTGSSVQVPGFNKPLTEAQGNAVSFSMRAQNALDNLEKLGKPISTSDYTASKVPVVGNYAMSTAGQQSMNAEKQFIAAVLRKESGAAISQGEYDSYGSQLFPRPGDSKATLDQKSQNRAIALEAMKIQSGSSGQQQASNAMASFKKPSSGGWSIQKVE